MGAYDKALGCVDIPVGPATNFESVNPGDPIPEGTRAIYIQVSGSYDITNSEGGDVQFMCFAGQILPVIPLAVNGPASIIALK